MSWIFKKKVVLEEPTLYSENWFDNYSDKSLRDLYHDYKLMNFDIHDEFILDLSCRIKSAFSIPYDDIQLFESTLLYNRLTDDVKDSLMSIEIIALRNCYFEMINILKDEFVNIIAERVKANNEKNSLDYILGTIHRLCEDCFNDIVFISAKAIEELKKNKLFKYAEAETILLEIIKETLKPDNFNKEQLRFSHKDHQSMRDKWYEIVIRHTVNKLNSLPVEEKIGLIPTIEQYLHNEQNFKVAKKHDYEGIEGLEEFYQLFLQRFKDLEIVNKEKEENIKGYFLVGKKDDSKEKIEKKTLQLRNFLYSIKHRFDNNPSDLKSIFKPWADEHKYKGNLFFIGDFKELMGIFGFLIGKDIVREANIKLLKNRVLINGERITKTDTNISVNINKFRKETSGWYKTYTTFLS
jgi:hypothetical protein